MKPMRHYGFRLLVLLIAASASNATAEEEGLVAPVFAEYALLLEHFLEEKRTPEGGLVSAFDYEAALSHERTDAWLEAQSGRLAAFDTDALDTREKALAFWINAYNYFMLEQVLTETDDGEPVDSVWDFGGRYNPFRDSVFEQRQFVVGGDDYSLDGIEKGTLLGPEFREKGWKDARVHFAVNCASVGCPPLRERIFTADNADRLLAQNTRLALNTQRQLRIEGDELHLSQLFQWYESDYMEAEGSVRAFIRKWAEPEVAQRVAATDAIHYIDYDWTLNRPENFPEFSQGDRRYAVDQRGRD